MRPSTACACQLKCGTGSATDGNSLQGGNLFAVSAYRGYHPRFSDPKLPLLQRAAWTAKDLKLKLQMCHGRCPHQRWQQYLAGAAWSTADFVEIVRRWAQGSLVAMFSSTVKGTSGEITCCMPATVKLAPTVVLLVGAMKAGQACGPSLPVATPRRRTVSGSAPASHHVTSKRLKSGDSPASANARRTGLSLKAC